VVLVGAVESLSLTVLSFHLGNDALWAAFQKKKNFLPKCYREFSLNLLTITSYLTLKKCKSSQYPHGHGHLLDDGEVMLFFGFSFHGVCMLMRMVNALR